jgi:hypothetical protein
MIRPVTATSANMFPKVRKISHRFDPGIRTYFILFYVLDVIHRRFAEQPALLSLSPGPYQDPYYVPYRRTDFVGVCS